MKSVHARDLAAMPIEQLWAMPDGPIEIHFDDGVLQTWIRPTIFSAYIWRIHREYPHTPLLMRHHMGNGNYVSDTHLDLLSQGVFDCYDAYNLVDTDDEGFDIEPLCRMAYQIFNSIYNDMTTKLDNHVTGISILDFVQILFHPEVKAINDHVQNCMVATNSILESARERILTITSDAPELAGNALQRAVRARLVNRDQVGQCVGPIGFRTDADSYAFKNPVRVSFTHGLYTLEDALKESRSATKSAHFNKNHVADSEYTNRNVQLSSSCLQRIHRGDCGSTVYLPYKIHNRKCLTTMNGIFRQGDLAGIRPVPIRPNDTGLIGQTVYIRTVFGCKHPDRYGVCVTCFGDLGISIPRKSNLGHISSTRVQGPLAQLILSTKHLDGNSVVEDIQLDIRAEPYIRLLDMGELGFTDRWRKTKFLLTVAASDAEHLHDLDHVTDVYTLTPARVSSISEMAITQYRKQSEITESFPIGTAARRPYFTHKMLDYIKRTGWTTNADGTYSIDMSNWDVDDTAFVLPLKQFSTPDYAKAIDTFIKSTKNSDSKNPALRGIKKLSDFPNPITALAEFHDLVSLKLSVNLSHLQTVILATMVEDLEGRDYGTPIDRMHGQAIEYRKIMEMRSLGATMAYEGQKDALYSPLSYTQVNRPPHILDDCLMG